VWSEAPYIPPKEVPPPAKLELGDSELRRSPFRVDRVPGRIPAQPKAETLLHVTLAELARPKRLTRANHSNIEN